MAQNFVHASSFPIPKLYDCNLNAAWEKVISFFGLLYFGDISIDSGFYVQTVRFENVCSQLNHDCI